MLNNKGNYQMITSFFFIIMVVISILVLIYFGLNSSVTSSMISQETQPLQEAVDLKSSITKCWGEMSFFSILSADSNKCFSPLENKITGYKVEVINFLGCSPDDMNAKEFGNTMNCKTKIPFIVSLKKDETTNCLGRLTLCFNESKRINSSYVAQTDTEAPATIISGCETGQSAKAISSQKITFACKDNVVCKKLVYSIEGVQNEYTYDLKQENEITLFPKETDTNYLIQYSSVDFANNVETTLIYYCAIKGEPYLPPLITNAFFKIDSAEQTINFSDTYVVDIRHIYIIKAKANKQMAQAKLLLDLNNCPDTNVSLSLEPSLVGDYNYYSQWVIPSGCNGLATGRIRFIDSNGTRVDSAPINFDLNSHPFDVNIKKNVFKDFNFSFDSISRFGRITNEVSGTDLNKDSCYFTLNNGVNWIKADWNNFLGGCDSKTIDLSLYGTSFIFNTKISNNYGETASGINSPGYYLDMNSPTVLLSSDCSNLISEKTINLYCVDKPYPNAGCKQTGIFYRLDFDPTQNVSLGPLQAVDQGHGILFDTDGNYLLEAYAVDNFSQIGTTLKNYCYLNKIKPIYLYGAEIKDSSLYLSAYKYLPADVTLFEDTNILDTLSFPEGVTTELIRPVYPGVVEGDKVKICLPDMTCSSEINVFEIRAGQKAGLVQNCGISFISDRSKNVCLFSDFDSISDLNTSTCMYSLDGANWASADYNTFNTKHGCKVTISEILFGTHNVLFKMLKNDSNTVFSPSSKADINNSSINISCRYADCS